MELNPTILAAALEGLEIRLANLNAMIADVKSRTSLKATKTILKKPRATKAVGKKRVLSEESRARMAEAQKKRWAAARKAKG
ncbi:MAG: hypothetical protein JNM66_13120 [Bryobacterales bacterium]|nr:hypothetical protein [Bryobacterales bacterium]